MVARCSTGHFQLFAHSLAGHIQGEDTSFEIDGGSNMHERAKELAHIHSHCFEMDLAVNRSSPA